MSVQYRAIGWNRQKRIYDLTLLVSVAAYLALFAGLGSWAHPNATIETLLIRGLGTASFFLLHVILSIGPLCRLDRRFLPLLYNRRHLGVTMFLLALGHGLFALIQFHALGDLNPLVSLLVSNQHYSSLAQFPFQQLGFLALLILFLMAATSHDFWLQNLSPPIWKRLHMGVYVAYGLLVAHVTLGALQTETSPLLAGVVALGLALVLGLHLAAANRERHIDRLKLLANADGYVEVCSVRDIPESRAKVISLGGERVAVFRYDGQISALSNVCAHQNGPLGEGKIVDGCVTCPWHGYQYLPNSGTSPPPFHEKVATFRVSVVGEKVLVHPQACEPGTSLEPARIEGRTATPGKDDFYIGYEPSAPRSLARFVRNTVVGLSGLSLAVALLLVFSQSAFLPSAFEFLQVRNFEGIVEESAVPALRIERPGAESSVPAFSRYLLVGGGKHGAAEQVSGFHGRRMRLSGSLIYREGATMIELVPGTLHPLGAGPIPESVTSDIKDLGIHELTGEIVDSKCYLGVMNPGQGKVHRDCAVRCISGGVPPAFLVRHNEGAATVLLLVGSEGEPIHRELLSRIAEPVQIRGRILRLGDTLIFRADLDTLTTVQ